MPVSGGTLPTRRRDRVSRQGEVIVFRKRGRAVAALIPMRHLKLLERLEDEIDVRQARKALKERGRIPWEKVKKDLGL